MNAGVLLVDHRELGEVQPAVQGRDVGVLLADREGIVEVIDVPMDQIELVGLGQDPLELHHVMRERIDFGSTLCVSRWMSAKTGTALL